MSTSDAVTVIVRDHGAGFEPGAGSGYESRLLALAGLLEPWGGTATSWSEPGGGVRVTLSIPAGDPDPDPDAELAGSDVSRFADLSAAEAGLANRTLLTALLAWRALSSDRWSDAATSAIDAATAACIVLLGRINLEDADRSTWINWPPWTFAHATQNRRVADALADSVALAAFFAVAGLLADQTRSSAVRLEQARTRAEAQGPGLARERERSVQLRVLHDHGLQTLQTIASGQFTDLDLVRSQAHGEATRLDRDLDKTGARRRAQLTRLYLDSKKP